MVCVQCKLVLAKMGESVKKRLHFLESFRLQNHFSQVFRCLELFQQIRALTIFIFTIRRI